MRAIQLGRAIVLLGVLIVGGGLWIYSEIDTALNFSEVSADVDHVEVLCVPVGTALSKATDCPSAKLRSQGKPLAFYNAVAVRYIAPGDQKPYRGLIIPAGGQSGVDAIHLKSGDHWTILVHDEDPHNIKAK